MKNLILTLFVFLFIVRCSGQKEYVSNTEKTINDKSYYWLSESDFNNYSINEFWSKEQDSSLFIVLSEFKNNNRSMRLFDIKSNIASLYYDISKADSYPQVSADINAGYGEQNLAALGLSDELLESVQGGGQSSEEGEGSGGGSPNNNSSSFGSATYSVKLNTVWEIDLWGRLKHNRKSKKSKLKSDLYDIKYAKISLTAQFIKLYISSSHINRQIEIFEENLKNLKEIKNITDKRIIEGLSNPDEVHLASANYYLYESNLMTKKIEMNSIKRNIELMLGRYPSSSFSASYSYPDSICNIKSEISSELLLRRPDILSFKEKLNSSKSQLIASKKSLFPSIRITNSVGQSSSDLKKVFDPQSSVWNIGSGILQPIFQSGKLKKNVKISEQDVSSSDIRYLEAVMNAFYETENCLDLDKNLKDVQSKIGQSKEDMQKAVNYAIRGYELGLVDLVYVLNLQQQLLNTKIQLENIIAKRYLNRIDLILALGGNFEY